MKNNKQLFLNIKERYLDRGHIGLFIMGIGGFVAFGIPILMLFGLFTLPSWDNPVFAGFAIIFLGIAVMIR